MDARLMAVFARLSEDLGNLERALASTQDLLRAITKDERAAAREAGGTGKAKPRNTTPVTATQMFLADQQPRWGGLAPWQARVPRENDDAE